jgi:hypothetical protein
VSAATFAGHERTQDENDSLASHPLADFVCAVWIPTYYPAPKPVIGSDGAPLLRPDGTPVVNRDMTEFYRYNAPAFAFLSCSVCLFGWALVRVFKSGSKQVPD